MTWQIRLDWGESTLETKACPKGDKDWDQAPHQASGKIQRILTGLDI
jgi:hypothetical protein